MCSEVLFRCDCFFTSMTFVCIFTGVPPGIFTGVPPGVLFQLSSFICAKGAIHQVTSESNIKVDVLKSHFAHCSTKSFLAPTLTREAKPLPAPFCWLLFNAFSIESLLPAEKTYF